MLQLFQNWSQISNVNLRILRTNSQNSDFKSQNSGKDEKKRTCPLFFFFRTSVWFMVAVVYRMPSTMNLHVSTHRWSLNFGPVVIIVCINVFCFFFTVIIILLICFDLLTVMLAFFLYFFTNVGTLPWGASTNKCCVRLQSFVLISCQVNSVSVLLIVHWSY